MYYKYQKDIEIAGEYDVLVCGGGSAGFAAAVQTARQGLRTCLIEQYGMLGGVMTSGGNTEVALFYAEGTQIVSGIGWEFVQRLERSGWATIPDFKPGVPHYRQGVNVNGPMTAHLLDEMCLEAGVRLLFHNRITDTIVTEENNRKRLRGVIIATKTGLRAIMGKVIIDCTGDGDVAALSGAEFEIGDKDTGELQPGTMRYYLKEYDLGKISAEDVKHYFALGIENGELKSDDYWSWPNANPYGIFRSGGNNANHIPVNGIDMESKTEAEIEGRRSVVRTVNWARKYIIGAGNAEPVACGTEVGIRETRRIVGEKYITYKDYLKAKVYDDAICYVYYPVDLHTTGGESLQNIFLEKGRTPTIPYGALVSKGFDNLLVAGRCISGDRLANSAFRMKAFCMAMGQAAGVAADLMIKDSVIAKDIDIKRLQDNLRVSGAIIP